MKMTDEEIIRNAEIELENFVNDSACLTASAQSVRNDSLENMLVGMLMLGYTVSRSGDVHFHIRRKLKES